MNFKIEGRITYLRKLNNLTQDDLSKRIHLTQPNIVRYEKGAPLPEDKRQEFSKAFKVPVTYFTATKPDPKVDELLDDTFGKLLNINIEPLAEMFASEPYELEISQEVAFRLLQAAYYYKSNQFEQGDKLSDNFISLFIEDEQQLKDHPTLLKCYYLYKHELNFKDNNLEECSNYCQLLAEIVDDNHQKGRCLVLMSQTAFRRGLMNKALTSTNKAITFIETFDKGLLLLGAYVTQSSVLISFKIYEDALEVLQEIENINQTINNPNIAAAIVQHRGFIFSKTKDYQKAIENYEMAYSNSKYPHNQLKLLISLISCHLKTKNIVEATKYLEIMRKKELRQHEKMIMMSFECEIHLYNGDINKHKKLLKIVLKYFEANNCLLDLKYIYSYLAKHHHEKHDYKEASTYFTKKEELEDE